MTSSNLSSAAFSTPLVEDSPQRRIKPKIIAPKLGNRLGILPDTVACRHERSRRRQYISKNWIYPADTVFHQPRAVLQAGSCSPRRPPGGTVEHEPRCRMRPSLTCRRPEIGAGRLARRTGWEFETDLRSCRQPSRPPTHQSSASHRPARTVDPHHNSAFSPQPWPDRSRHVQRAAQYPNVIDNNSIVRLTHAKSHWAVSDIKLKHGKSKYNQKEQHYPRQYITNQLCRRTHVLQSIYRAKFGCFS